MTRPGIRARRSAAATRTAVKRADLWGGRFSAPPGEALRRLNDSFSFDRELFDADVEASIAWAEALRRARALRPVEAARLVRALRAIRAEGCAAARDGEHEDVHSYVEAALARRVGALAGKLHTGRSRNDQVATDLRLYLRGAFGEAQRGALDLAGALAARAEREAATAMPGYTHSKRAEPVTFGHWCLAYVEMLLRDAARLASAGVRADECPLGAGALSGTPLSIDRARLARALAFARPSANSLDAVSDRDAAAEYLFAADLLLVHLSRMAEDLIFFSSDESGFVELPDSLATGSSRMPHKKNPDVLELARGHAGRAIGDLAGLLSILKGLPLAYDKDLQLDKEPVFRARRTLAAVLPAIAGVIRGLSLDREAMRSAAADERFLVTELADALARRGVPFREAHATVGRRLAAALAARTTLCALGEGGGIRASDLAALDVDRALARRAAAGGTAPRAVRRAAGVAARRIARLARAAGAARPAPTKRSTAAGRGRRARPR